MIRHARARAGLTQVELADRAGTSQPALARYETGAALPTLPTLERLLRACGAQLQLRATHARKRPAPRSRCAGSSDLVLESCAVTAGACWTQRARGACVRFVSSDRWRGPKPGLRATSTCSLSWPPGGTLLDLVGFRREAEDILGQSIDVATADMLKERIHAEVLAEALTL
jgi:uncharacterized protein